MKVHSAVLTGTSLASGGYVWLVMIGFLIALAIVLYAVAKKR